MPNLTLCIANPFYDTLTGQLFDVEAPGTLEVNVSFDWSESEPDVGYLGGPEDICILEPYQHLNKITDAKFWASIEQEICTKYDPNDAYDESDDRDSWDR